jgi:iron complex transport system substrate-binding protein
MKIVSLLPSATEIVYALDLSEDLVGVTHECDHPPAARAKPCVSTTSLSLDDGVAPAAVDRLVSEKVASGEPLYVLDERRIRELQPDLILAQDLCKVCAVPSGQVTDALDKIGCSADVVSLDPSTVDEILDGIVAVGSAAGREELAGELVRSLGARVEAVATKASSLPVPRVLALEWPEPPFAGGHWVPEMIELAGGADVLGTKGAPSRRVSWDEVAAAAPEVVVYMPCGYGLAGAAGQAHCLFEVPPFRSTPAAREGAVFAVDASAYFSRPGPRVVDGLEILAWALHPESFPNPPAGTVARIAPG